MKWDWSAITKAFSKQLSQDKKYNESLELVKLNSTGEIWLFGSAVYKKLISQIYNSKFEDLKDYDFIVSKINQKIQIPQNWKINPNRSTNFTNPKFLNLVNDYGLDLVALDNIHYLKKNNFESTIENYLKHSSLNIFSLVYNIKNSELIGIAGKQALERKIIRINDIGNLKEIARLYQTTPGNIITKKAEELSFKADYTY